MTRPVRGFLTKQGKFFDTKIAAQTYEATTEFHEKLQAHLEASGFGSTLLDFTMDKVREFVLLNREVVKDYISLVKSIPEPTKYDLRVELLHPQADPEPPVFEPLDEDQDAFVQAFSDPLGSDDGEPEASGNDEEVRQLGEEP